jgi:hexokinase
LLLERLSERGGRTRVTSVRVVNDTIATLFAGLPGVPADGYIGLVVGTGANMAAFIDGARIPKLEKTGTWPGPLPVNLEAGNFRSPFLTRWDDDVDAASENPGEQRLEKAVSGLYLGRVFKAILPEADFDAASGGEGLVRFMDRHAGTGGAAGVARKVYERSARLTAAALAGLAAFLGGDRPLKTLKIVAEGGLFWSSPARGPGYASIVEATFAALMPRLGMDDLAVQFAAVRNATLSGSALAALG